jgi:hypothetical protein
MRKRVSIGAFKAIMIAMERKGAVSLQDVQTKLGSYSNIYFVIAPRVRCPDTPLETLYIYMIDQPISYVIRFTNGVASSTPW